MELDGLRWYEGGRAAAQAVEEEALIAAAHWLAVARCAARESLVENIASTHREQGSAMGVGGGARRGEWVRVA